MVEFGKYTVGIYRETNKETEEMMEFTIKREATLSEIVDVIIKAMFKERGDYAPPAMKEMIGPAPDKKKEEPLTNTALW